jgi:hypothetical protein
VLVSPGILLQFGIFFHETGFNKVSRNPRDHARCCLKLLAEELIATVNIQVCETLESEKPSACNHSEWLTARRFCLIEYLGNKDRLQCLLWKYRWAVKRILLTCGVRKKIGNQKNDSQM